MSAARYLCSEAGRFCIETFDRVRRGLGGALTTLLCLCAAWLPAQNVLGADPNRPMGGACATTFVFTSPAGAVHLDGTCHYLHLGLTILSAEQHVIPLSGNIVLITNTAVYTAANGDQLFANFVGTGILTPPTATFSGTETYTGGTGRFSDAAGSVALEGSALFTSPIAGTGEYATKGAISY